MEGLLKGDPELALATAPSLRQYLQVGLLGLWVTEGWDSSVALYRRPWPYSITWEPTTLLSFTMKRFWTIRSSRFWPVFAKAPFTLRFAIFSIASFVLAFDHLPHASQAELRFEPGNEGFWSGVRGSRASTTLVLLRKSHLPSFLTPAQGALPKDQRLWLLIPTLGEVRDPSSLERG